MNRDLLIGLGVIILAAVPMCYVVITALGW
jgi:hypothetical protein